MNTRARLARLEREAVQQTERVVAVLTDDHGNRIEVTAHPRGRSDAKPTSIHIGGLDLALDV